MSERCEKHHITRCLMCSGPAKKASGPFKAPVEFLNNPATNPGAPPPDIETVGTEANAAGNRDLEAQRADYEKTLREKRGEPVAPVAPYSPEQAVEVVIDPLVHQAARELMPETLPTDDSHASKVVRAAALYATVCKDWAQNLARVEKIKSELTMAEALLNDTAAKKEAAEFQLKTLVTREAA